MGEPARARARRTLIRTRAADGGPDARHLPRHAGAVRPLDRARADRRARADPRRGHAARHRRPAGPAHRLERGVASSGRRRSPRASRRRAVPSTTCTRSRRARTTPTTSSAAPSTASASRRSSAHGSVFGVQFHPEKSSRARASDARELRRLCGRRIGRRRARGGGARMILLPAVDILDGKAVRLDAGRRSTRRRSTTPIRSTPRGAGSRTAPARCTSSTSTVRAAARRPTSSTSGGSPRTVDVPVQVGGGLRTIEAVRRTQSRPARRAWCSAPRRSATSTSSMTALAEYGDRVVVSVDARDGHAGRLGLDRADRASRSSP